MNTLMLRKAEMLSPKESVDINPHAPQMDHEDLLMVDQNRCKSSSLLH